MIGNKKKVFVALSGGVDSSTATAILQRDGFDCEGVFMITNDSARHAQTEAEMVAGELGIRLHVMDLREDFKRILDYFSSEYRKGRTPNPCVFCNRHMKFSKLWEFATSHGARFLATGHYARVLNRSNNVGLYEAANPSKDQSYVLSMINKEMLPNIILPMGDYSKNQTREMASEFGLRTAQSEESQEICFIPDDDYVAVLEQRCPELVRKGNIVDSSGKILGEHNGVHRFTIGQRRGLRVAMGKPFYVTKIDAESNTVTLGPKEEVMRKKLRATGTNWLIDEPVLPFRAKVKIRYNSKGALATVIPQGNSVAVEFDEPVSAITPGQLAAFYIQEEKNNRLIGGGWIDNGAG
ncbi:MAG: tRNA 2-thiouridine(34) synthase MnmA [Planctomycetes bacterium RBG_13_50_24]|nr:MAG: tRNA 2-thiouridine(34) synthase MnmA [Planctomycetes bacterium RBG_13_50_24]